MLVLSAEDRIADINPAGERLLGISSDQAIGRLLSELMPQYLPIIEQYRHVYEEKTELQLVDGRYIDLTITPLKESNQKYGGRLILLRDISAGKQAELELARNAISSHRSCQPRKMVSSLPMQIRNLCIPTGLFAGWAIWKRSRWLAVI